MDWVETMNKAIDYVEEHLTNRVDMMQIARITACPLSVFQRSFAQISGVTLSEYIRRRKLTCAAAELQNTDVKIIDLALKYGYESPDAFRVAFKRLHGVTPVMARKSGIRMTFYCRLSFALTIKGVEKMDYTIIKKPSFKVVGIRRTTPYGGGTWAIVKTDGTGEQMEELCGHICDLGLCFGFGEDGSNDYMCGVEWPEDVLGFDSYVYPEQDWLIFELAGPISENVLGNVWQRINNEFMPQSKYKKDGPTIEKYIVWNDAEDYCKMEIWIPAKLK